MYPRDEKIMKKLQLAKKSKGNKCKVINCKRDWLSFGFCLEHFLQAEEEWVNKSRKASLTAR
jgi:hypothetical protein